MAAYASLVSLTNTLEQILSHPHLSISFDKTQIQSLVEKIVLLQQFLETYSHGISTQLLETQIASAAHAAEDAVESHVADQILAGSDSPFLLDEAVMEAIDAVKKNVMKAIDQGDLQAYPTPASPARSPTIEKSSMVGFDDYLIRLMDKLTGPQPSLQVVPVVGMGGIGNLQIISIKGCQKQELALSDIWEMPQVRHLKVDICKISDPPQNDVVLHNLQTLSGVENFRLSEEVCKRIPNIKKLSGVYTDPRQSSHYFLHNVLQGGVYTDARQRSHYCLHNVGRLHQLRSLNLCFDNLPLWRDVLQDITLPSSLEKLSLYGCKLHWEDLSMFGSLPNLQVLKLEFEAVTGREWNPVEGEFCCLKFLKLSVCTGLGEWNADSCHFPVIESIFLEALSELDAIPWGVGESPTLKLIRLKDCTVACAMSAMEILVEQESYNEELQLEVQFGLQAKMVSFKQMLEQEGLGSNNLTTLCK